jgi:hypothetical protein
MSRRQKVSLLGLFLCLSALSLQTQTAPNNDRHGESASIIRNDASSSITIEMQVDGKWQAISIDPNQDANISGQHVRVATTRQDGAVISIDLPLKAGKKYRVFWNDQTRMWDFALSQ